MAELVTVVRGLHLLFALLWGGASVYHGTVVMGGFMHRQKEARRHWWTQGKFGPFLGMTSLLTVVFGLWTYLAVGPENYAGGEEAVLMVGMAAGIVGTVVGWGGHMPAAVGMARAVKAGDDATLARLEERDRVLDKVSLVVVLIAVLSMVTFRMFA